MKLMAQHLPNSDVVPSAWEGQERLVRLQFSRLKDRVNPEVLRPDLGPEKPIVTMLLGEGFHPGGMEAPGLRRSGWLMPVRSRVGVLTGPS